MMALRSKQQGRATTKPNSGEKQQRVNDLGRLAPVHARCRLPDRAADALATPTPITDPIRVCELDAGRPRYHVPMFQIIAAISRAKTMAKPAPLPTCRISSTGSSETMPKATAPEDSSTPNRLNRPDHTTAILAGIERV